MTEAYEPEGEDKGMDVVGPQPYEGGADEVVTGEVVGDGAGLKLWDVFVKNIGPINAWAVSQAAIMDTIDAAEMEGNGWVGLVCYSRRTENHQELLWFRTEDVRLVGGECPDEDEDSAEGASAGLAGMGFGDLGVVAGVGHA